MRGVFLGDTRCPLRGNPHLPAPGLVGWIIGSRVTVRRLAIGIISDGSLNTAVSFGIGAVRISFGGNFLAVELAAAKEAAAAACRLWQPSELAPPSIQPNVLTYNAPISTCA